MTPAEFNPIDPALERAVSEIRDEAIDPAVIEAAAARVWTRLVQAAEPKPAEHIRGCADFQSLMPELRAGRLPAARATLLRDHLHECVACRKVYEGKVVALPVAQPARRASYTVRWAAAAAIVAATGLSIWIAVDQFGTHTGRAIVQTVNGTLYEVTASGIRPLTVGQDLPDGVELRTAKDSDAMLQLRDGSVVELRERSDVSTSQTASDLTIRLVRGSVIVQAAKRRTGHLYVATADCRVAVTGTVFSVSSGVKGSRVSVVQGEVHVSHDNQDRVLHPGEQAVTSASLEQIPVKDDISWSRNRDRLTQQLDALRSSLQQIHLPALRYSSRLLSRLPASTVFFASIPNLGQYMTQAETVFRQKMAESPELSQWWSNRGPHVGNVLDKLRAANEYFGDEIVIVAVDVASETKGPVFITEVKRDGFPEFLHKEAPEVAIQTRPGIVAFGADRAAVDAVAAGLDSSAFQGTPFYAQIAQSISQGAGFLLSADLSHMSHNPIDGARYFTAGEREIGGQMEGNATLGFAGPRTGIAAWLADPSPMGSLDFVSPEATVVAAFVVKSPVAIVNQILELQQRSAADAEKTVAEIQQDAGFDVRNDLAGSLGGEFSLSLDGQPFPVPSWKLAIEVYDPDRLQSTLQKAVDAINRSSVSGGVKAPLRTSQETVDGRTYYMIAGADANPLTEVHYTFADGYLIAAPSRALITKALATKLSGTSITHADQFVNLTPRDHYAHYSAVLYQNLGKTLAPLTGLLGAFIPQGHGMDSNAIEGLGNMKPSMIALYGEPDRITVAAHGSVLGSPAASLLRGNLMGAVTGAVPFAQFQGTHVRQPAFK